MSIRRPGLISAWEGSSTWRASHLQRVVDPVLRHHYCNMHYQPAMAANALHDYIRSLDDLATEMPNVISRWDSHETSPMPADAPKLRQALPSVANEPYRHRRGRAGVKILNRR
jgi:hypothetical protein